MAQSIVSTVSPVDRSELQALVLTGLPKQRFARFRLLRIGDRDRAHGWLAGELERLTFGDVPRAAIEAAGSVRNLAFTAAGLAAMGLPPDLLGRFDAAFLDGMDAPQRARRMGDISADGWAWGAGDRAPHILQLLYATDEEALDALLTEAEAETRGALTDIVPPRQAVLQQTGTTEHFGFSDGISQPSYAGIQSSASKGGAMIATGELLPGFPDGLGLVSRAVSTDAAGAAADLARHGSYLVCRQLAQDVAGFAEMLDRLADTPFVTERAPGWDAARRREWIASRIVGRWRQGCPVSLSPERDDPAHCQASDFDFVPQDDGFDPCPRGAHIRRAYPRGSVFRVAPPVGDAEREAARAAADRRRLLRRGRAYGPRYAPGNPASAKAERGLMFVALCADIERQFEFVQGSWLRNRHFAELPDEADPLIGDGGTFTLPDRNLNRRMPGLDGHVTLRGGGYFFLPGRSALGWLAAFDGAQDC